MNKTDLLVGGMLMASGIYAWSYIHFHPDKLSPGISRKTFRWMCIGMIIFGALAAFARLVFSR
jgi:hypothetical protein